MASRFIPHLCWIPLSADKKLLGEKKNKEKKNQEEEKDMYLVNGAFSIDFK